MTAPSTVFQRAAEDQSILHFSGTFDRLAAEKLWNEAVGLAQQGYTVIHADMSAAGPVLAEGVLALLELQEGLSEGECKLCLVQLSDSLLRSFQMYGMLTQNRQACLRLPCREARQRAGFHLRNCPSCGATLRIRQAGAHLCPRCGSRFVFSG